MHKVKSIFLMVSALASIGLNTIFKDRKRNSQRVPFLCANMIFTKFKHLQGEYTKFEFLFEMQSDIWKKGNTDAGRVKNSKSKYLRKKQKMIPLIKMK